MTLILNGQTREFDMLTSGCAVQQFVDELALKGDRIAVELNGNIVSRKDWDEVFLKDEDRLEIVHFVGGG
jgi:sulfur carrier protein